MTLQTIDLYGVIRDRQDLLDKARGPRFASWWQVFTARQEERLGQPVYPSISGLEEMDGEAAYT